MKLIQNQTKLFGYIDSDFENWMVDEGVEKSAKKLIPNDLKKNSTFAEMFTKNDYISQKDMIDWVEKNKEEILKTGKYYFFLLMNSKGSLFVARVFESGGKLEVYVIGFSDDNVWVASYGNIFVLPQRSET